MLLIDRAYWMQRLLLLSQRYEVPESLLLLNRPEEWSHYPTIYQSILRYCSHAPVVREDDGLKYINEYIETGVWALEGFFLFRDVERFAVLSEMMIDFLNKTENKYPFTQAIIHNAKFEMNILEMAFSRVLRYITWEKFELCVNDIAPQEGCTASACFWVAMALSQEKNPDHVTKGGHWLHQAWQKSHESLQRLLQGYLIGLQVNELNANNKVEVEKKVLLFKNHTTFNIDKNKRFWGGAGLELWASFMIAKAHMTDAPAAKKNITEPLISEIEAEAGKSLHKQDVHLLLRLNQLLFQAVGLHRKYDHSDNQKTVERMQSIMDKNIELSDSNENLYLKAGLIAEKAQFLLEHAVEKKEKNHLLTPSEKKNLSNARILQEWKEALRLFKKGEYRAELSLIYIGMAQTQYRLASHPHHVWDALIEGHKFAMKKSDTGGFYVVHRLFEYATEVFISELERPGYSWVIEHIPDYFALQENYLKMLSEGGAALIGQTEWNLYRETFYQFRNVASVHARTFLRYQLFSIKVLKISAMVAGDAAAQRQADYLLQELKSPMNPLSIIDATWSDAKELAEKIQDKLLQRAILMMKGDLQKVAEHLPFSYRNLRNYISLGQIKRLGYFKMQNQTNQRILETGIRIILEEIFHERKDIEGLYDLPRFLVEKTTQKPFNADELTVIQGIKEQAARRYAKLFAENGLLKPDEKRKNYYSVNKEFIQRTYLERKERLKNTDDFDGR